MTSLRWFFFASVSAFSLPQLAQATVFTFTRAQINQMAGYWEVDSVQMSNLADGQYPTFTNTWAYIVPGTSRSSDGDIHINMAVDSSGTGQTSDNSGESPIVAEVINATSAQLSHLDSLSHANAKTRGIFRLYTEHSGERKFEIHPMTELLKWNGTAFVFDSDYRTNITYDNGNTTHPNSSLAGLFDGSETATVTIMADNTNLSFTTPSPSINYVLYDGAALSGLLNDSVSPYFLFRPNLVPSATVRCRIVTNTLAAFNATGLTSNQTVSLSALTRTDMLVVSNVIASLTAGGSLTFARPVELITFSVSSTGVVSTLPVISNVQASNISNTTAAVQWTTDVSSDSQVLYGTSPATVTNQASGGVNVTNHVVNLTGLQQGTQYYFSVSSTSTGGTAIDDDQGAFYTFTTTAPASLQSIQTVFIILMENTSWSSIRGSSAAPYINHALLPMASHAEQYFTPPGNHPSLPNYLWLEAGTNFGILADGDPSSFHQSTTNHLVTLLKNAGISWTSYQEDINGATCPLTAVIQYAPKHNPMVYFDDVTNTNDTSSAYCIANVRPFTELAGDLQSNVVTRYNFITPNLCDDMHGNTGCPSGNLITQGDTWLSNNVPTILNSQTYSNNGALFIVWDEGGSSSDGPIGMIVISRLAKGGGYSNTVHYTHSSTLRTMEEIFNVGPLLNDAANATDLADLFNLGAAPAQLDISPGTGLTSSGPVGGPFSPISQTYTLSNSGGATLSWTASKAANWVTLSATAGTLAPGSNAAVTVSINANANSLTANSYSDTVSFTNTTNGAGNDTRPVSLTVTNGAAQLAVIPATGLTSRGLVGGPFSPISQTYTLSNAGGATLSWTASNTANWLTLSATAGTLPPGSNTTVTVSINANANSLSAGGYSDTVSFTNATNGAGNTTRPVSLTISNRTPVIVTNGSTLASEGCTPTNGVIDPGEVVTVNFSLKNIGSGDTGNLVATLLATNGVTLPSGPQTYGVVAAGGGVGTQPFTFTASGTCGGNIAATLQLQDGLANLGSITYIFPLGQAVTPLAENFDTVAAPALPAGWSTTASGAESNWVTSTALADSPLNAAFTRDPGAVGINEIDTPTISVTSTSAVLTFRQNYSLAASPTNSSLGLDGGVLEIKMGSGSYTDILAAGGSFVGGGYNATLVSTNGNPLAGRQAWSGNSSGFITTVVNLPAAAAGQNVQLRWRCGAGNVPSNSVASSGTLAYWNFDSSSPNANLTATNILASPVTLSNASGSLTYFGGNPGNAVASSGFTTSAGPPTSSYSYFAFALTVTNGSQASLSSISFDDRASSTGPKSFDVQVSQQSNFSSMIYDSGVHTTHTAFATTPMNTLTLINSGLTGTVYFRIYGYAAGGSAGTWRLDNLNVQGSVAGAGGVAGAGWYIDSVSINDFACCISPTNNPPAASFSASPTNGTEPLIVTFSDTSTGSITNRSWDFGDSSTTNITTNTVVHTYPAGTFTVTLVASGPAGVSTNIQANYITVLTAFQAWQIQYFGSTNNPAADPNADPDGDGMSNMAEFLTGTDPTNSASAFRITSIALVGTDLEVDWMMGPGKTNALERSLGDVDGNYSNNFADIFIVTNTVGSVTNYLDLGATNFPARYYRVRLVP